MYVIYILLLITMIAISVNTYSPIQIEGYFLLNGFWTTISSLGLLAFSWGILRRFPTYSFEKDDTSSVFVVEFEQVLFIQWACAIFHEIFEW